MTDQPDNPNSEPKIYSVSLEEDGRLNITRREFLSMALAVGGALMLTRCKARQLMRDNPTDAPMDFSVLQPSQTFLLQTPSVNMYAEPDESSEVLEVLHTNDVVRLLVDRPNQEWVHIFSPTHEVGYLRSEYVDLTRAYTRELVSDPLLPLPLDQDINDPIYLVVVIPGGPEPELAVTCPQYGGPTMYIIGETPLPTVKPYSDPSLPMITIEPPDTHLCACVGYTSCPCVSYSACSCVSFSSCPCLTHIACTCVGYVPCTCVSYNPCSCLSFNTCGCVGYSPCGCVAYIPCMAT